MNLITKLGSQEYNALLEKGLKASFRGIKFTDLTEDDKIVALVELGGVENEVAARRQIGSLFGGYDDE